MGSRYGCRAQIVRDDAAARTLTRAGGPLRTGVVVDSMSSTNGMTIELACGECRAALAAWRREEESSRRRRRAVERRARFCGARYAEWRQR